MNIDFVIYFTFLFCFILYDFNKLYHSFVVKRSKVKNLDIFLYHL